MEDKSKVKLNKQPFSKYKFSKIDSENQCTDNLKKQTIIADVRTQFAFIAESSIISRVTEIISNYGISLDGFLLLTIDNKKNIFKFVVGDSNEQAEFEVETVRCILKDNDINFCEKTILKLFYPYHTPDTFSSLYAGLSESLTVISIYTSTDNDIYLETSSLDSTIKILSNLT